MRPTGGRYWQYPYRTALQIAGPQWHKTSDRTHLKSNWGTVTANQPLPLGLSRSTAQLPPLDLSRFNETLLGRMVSNIPEPEYQQEIENEADVIVHMGPFSLQVAEQLVPSYIEGMGLEGKIKFNREGTSDNSRPDCVITFDDKPIISFDYKGPNCVRDDELEQCTVASVTEAKEKIAQWGKILQRFAQGHEKQGDTMLRVQGITIDTERLTQTAIKYAKQVGTPVVIFYDFDTLTVMKPPSGMVHDNDNLMEVRIWREPQKSTEDNLVETQDNHVSILIRHIVDMVHRVKAEE